VSGEQSFRVILKSILVKSMKAQAGITSVAILFNCSVFYIYWCEQSGGSDSVFETQTCCPVHQTACKTHHTAYTTVPSEDEPQNVRNM
jgi:hypothetical protein